MKGIIAYILPKVVKVIAGVAVGLFVFNAFKRVYEPVYTKLMGVVADLSGYHIMAVSGMSSVLSYSWCDWVLLVNAVLPINELFSTLAFFFPMCVTIYTCRFVFRVLDTWMAGVLSIVNPC